METKDRIINNKNKIQYDTSNFQINHKLIIYLFLILQIKTIIVEIIIQCTPNNVLL